MVVQQVPLLPHGSMVPGSVLNSGYSRCMGFLCMFSPCPFGFSLASLVSSHLYTILLLGWYEYVNVCACVCVRMETCDGLRSHLGGIFTTLTRIQLNEWMNEWVSNNGVEFFMNIWCSSLSYRFGDGYTVILRLPASAPDPGAMDAYIKSCFPGIELKERHHNVLHYQLPTRACSLAHVFSVLSSSRKELRIAEYSVSQTTLDQVRTQQKWLYG